MTQIYKIGTVTVTNGSTAVTGDDTGWATALVNGGLFTRNGLSVPIESVEGEGALTLTLPWPGSSGAGAYAIMRENSAAASVVDMFDRMSRALISLSLHSIHPNAAGTLAERDALTLGAEETQFVFLRLETGQPDEYYRWGGAAWVGPFPVRGPAGEDSTIPGPPGEGFTPAGAWEIGTTYDGGDFVSFGGRTFVSLADGNLGNEPPSADEDDANWMWVPVANGRTILSGSADPTAEGVDGDFYINTSTLVIFGPKVGGAWPAGVSLKGSDGADGADPGVLLTFDTGTADADPGGGKLRASNADLSAATFLYVSKANRAASSIASLLLSIGASTNATKGALLLTDPATDKQAAYQVVIVADAVGYVKVGVTDHAGETAFADDLPISFQFTRAGDKGLDGVGAGDTVGPPNSADGEIALFDGVTGKLLKRGALASSLAPLNSPDLTGNPTAPTQTAGNNTTRLANTAFVTAAIQAIVGMAPADLDTLLEIADRIQAGEELDDSIVASLAGKLTASSNLSDLANASAALTNLGLSANGKSLVTAANYAAMKTLLTLVKADVGLGNVDNTSNTTERAAAATLQNKTLVDPAITGCILEDVYTIVDAAGFEIDPGNGSIQFVTLGASRTPAATNFQNGESVTLRIADGTAFTITWSTVGVVWKGGTAPTLATSGYTEVNLEKSGGVIRGVHVGDFAS